MLASVFISHASEDKEAIARPLAHALRESGILDVWYDEFSLKVGDSLKQSIDRGLADCDYGVVILSKHFFAKSWPKEELDGLTSNQIALQRKVILPVWHEITFDEVRGFSPTLAGKYALNTNTDTHSAANIAEKLIDSILDNRPREDFNSVQWANRYGGSVRVFAGANASYVDFDRLGLDGSKCFTKGKVRGLMNLIRNYLSDNTLLEETNHQEKDDGKRESDA